MSKKIEKKFDFIRAKELKGLSLLEAEMFDFSYKKHLHKEYSIGVTREGIQSFNCKGDSYKVSKNGIITFNPEDVHDGYAELESGLKYQMLYISSDIIDNLSREMCGEKFNNVYFKNVVQHDSEVAYRLLDLFKNIKKEKIDSLEIQTKFYDTISILFERYGGFSKKPINFYKDNSLIAKACKYIEENANSNISLDDIANKVALSPYHFSRIFKKTTLMSPHNYLNQCRVEIVKKQLDEYTSLSELSEIALSAGFSDQSHMNRRFKEIYGITPGQYKNALR